MKVLISRPDKIGDVVLALHGVKQLKRLMPEAQVYLHVSQYTAPLVRKVKFVDGCITSRKELRSIQFDVVVDLIAKYHVAKQYLSPKIPVRIGNSARWFSFLYNRTRYVRRSRALVNEAEYNWQLLSLIDPCLKNTILTERLTLDDFEKVTPFEREGKYAVVMPGVTVSAVGWKFERWLDVIQRLAESEVREVVVLLGPAEEELAERFRAQTAQFETVVVKAVQDFSVLLGILKNASTYLGPSTGITHLASVAGVPGVALYPEMRSMHPDRWLPFRSSLEVVSLDKDPSPASVVDILRGGGVGELAPVNRAPISAFVICRNEEKNIRRCLESIKWCDEIVVVDSGSTDQTVEIAREYTDKVIERDWPGHSAQKQFALEQCSNNWILNIDSDEEVSIELKGQIQRLLALPAKVRDRVHGYDICRVVYFLEQWWEQGGWYPEYRMRLFQRKFASWGGIDPHEKAVVEGKTDRISGALYHFTYSGIPHQIETLNKHSTISARYLFQEGKRCRLYNIVFNPLLRFLKFYVVKRGFRAGVRGFIVGGIEACYTFFKYVKLWELMQQRELWGRR